MAAEAISSTPPSRRRAERPEGSPPSVERSSARAVALGLRLAGRARGLGSTSSRRARRRRAGTRAELAQALGDARRLELVGEHRGDRHRQPRGDLEHRQVGADHGIEQPLLAERVGAEALDVGHVRVEDDREVPAASSASHGGLDAGSGMADRDEVERSVELGLRASAKSRRRSPA